MANTTSGTFNGLQTIKQLLPVKREVSEEGDMLPIQIKNCEIEDAPRFGWRGLMLDVSRHFFTVDEVKAYLDQMAEFKFNVFHWHLTDDEGWRIEIKTFPRLTEVGAWRVERHGRFGSGRAAPKKSEKATYGGFYTQEEIKDVIAYAAARNITIVPEIDVPGHSMALLAAYPQYSTKKEFKHVNPGAKFADWFDNGTFKMNIENTLNPADPAVYAFLDMLFDEVAALFPGEYIHMGGDECPKNYWDKNPQIQALRIKEGLNNSQEVQAYFTRRLEKIITSKGKKMMGWDEILEGGGLPKNTAVMSWRGIKGGIQAANDGHQVVMTPNSNVYLDLMQGDGIIEPPVYETVRLKNSYDFNPVPEGVNAALIKGGQANLWSEQLFTYRHLQYMLYPRAWAVAEDLWSANENKNWNNFIGRVENHFERSDVAEIKYARSMYDPIFKFSKTAKGEIEVDMAAEVGNISFHYSFDHSNPDQFYPIASGHLIVPKDAVEMRVISYRGKKPMGQMIRFPISDMLKRIK